MTNSEATIKDVLEKYYIETMCHFFFIYLLFIWLNSTVLSVKKSLGMPQNKHQQQQSDTDIKGVSLQAMDDISSNVIHKVGRHL